MTERRTARRYDLTLPVVIRVPIERESVPRSGRTRDISTHGVYLLVDNELSPGAELDLTMTLPAEVTGGTEVFIRAIGRVVRVEKTPESSSNHLGAAAVIERYEIIRNEVAVS
jgi:c-di-GMP-binding flagellar brake protein YcgR